MKFIKRLTRRSKDDNWIEKRNMEVESLISQGFKCYMMTYPHEIRTYQLVQFARLNNPEIWIADPSQMPEWFNAADLYWRPLPELKVVS